MKRLILAGACVLIANALAAAEVYRVPGAFFVQLVQTTVQPTRNADGNTTWGQGPEDAVKHIADVPRVVFRSETQRPFPDRITVVFAVKLEDEALHSTAISMIHEGEGSYTAKAAKPEEKAALIAWAARHWKPLAKGQVVLERVDGAPEWSRAVAAEEDGTTIRLEVPGALPVPYPIEVPD